MSLSAREELQKTALLSNDGKCASMGKGLMIKWTEAVSACRSALRADPANPTFMFLLGRALSLGNKRLEAIKYYLDAADRGHAGAMNDLAGMFEYGVGVYFFLNSEILGKAGVERIPLLVTECLLRKNASSE